MKKCKYCDKEDTPDHFGPCGIKNMMIETGLCFNCAFWEIHARDFEAGKEKEKVFFVHGTRYHDGGKVDKKITRGFLGYGGADWIIKMKDTGKVIETNNLWCQGDVPEHFKCRMPDNAEFIEIEHPEREKLLKSLFPNN